MYVHAAENCDAKEVHEWTEGLDLTHLHEGKARHFES